MNGFDLSTISDLYVGSARKSAIYYGSTLIWPTDYATQYLTIESLEDNNNIYWHYSGNANSPKTIQWSTNKTTWNSVTASQEWTAFVTLNTNKKVYIKGSNISYAELNSSLSYNYLDASKTFNVSGNIMSLIYGDNFANQTTLTGSYTFAYFFNSDNIIDISNLILPATTLTEGCYDHMFYDHAARGSQISIAPELPATTLAESCYAAMFAGCTSLTTAPELPATTLAESCYVGMFSGCTSLTTSPALPATTLAPSCYDRMFAGCHSLTTAPELPATTLADFCYFQMFLGCTSLTTAPELSATTLTTGCYYWMFYGCTNLNYIKCLATNISALGCTDNWVYDVASTGTFVAAYDMDGWIINSDSGVPTGWTYQKEDHDYSLDYFTITSLQPNNEIYFETVGTSTNLGKTIQYSTDLVNWTSYTDELKDNASPFITLSQNQSVYIKGTNTKYASSATIYDEFYCSADTKISGNIMSLIYGDNFVGQTTLTANYTFVNLLSYTKCKTAINLVLPATTLTTYCYNGMFYNCTSLTTAPALPATTLAHYCYQIMFSGCTSLTTAPALPATTLAQYCYYRMFYGCTSLTTAPALPATTLAHYCYAYMFEGCSSLTTAPALPATTLATNCYMSMFANSGLTTAPTLSATTMQSGCYRNMFYGCTSLTTAPALPATTLASRCYQHMFYGCTSLTTAPNLNVSVLSTYCYAYMFQNCSSLNTVKCLATNISASNCTTNWLSGTATYGLFTKHRDMANWPRTASGIPSNWTVQSVTS